MYIEDIILTFFKKNISVNRYDANILTSFTEQILNHKGFTEKQSALAIKICNRYQTKLNLAIGRDISQFLDFPQYKLIKRILNSQKIMSIIENDAQEKIISVVFPYNEDLVKKFRDKRESLLYIEWISDKKCWHLGLDERSIVFLYGIKTQFEFIVDEQLERYFEITENIFKNVEKYVPMATFLDNKVKFVNLPKNIPEIKGQDLIETLILARNYGISTWDDSIQNHLSNENENISLIEFLNSNPGVNYKWDIEKFTENSLVKILTHLFPILVVVPVGAELETCKKVLNLCQKMNIANNEISILFRLSNETDEKFNNFVRNNKLNNPISEKTKLIIISGRVPKTLIAKKINFNCILNYNLYNMHYTIQDLIKNSKNVISIISNTNQKDMFWENV